MCVGLRLLAYWTCCMYIPLGPWENEYFKQAYFMNIPDFKKNKIKVSLKCYISQLNLVVNHAKVHISQYWNTCSDAYTSIFLYQAIRP